MGKRIWLAAAALLFLAVLLPVAAVAPKLAKPPNGTRAAEKSEDAPSPGDGEAAAESSGFTEAWQDEDGVWVAETGDGFVEVQQNEDGIWVVAGKAPDPEPVATLEDIRAAGPSDIPADTPAYDAASYLMYHGVLKGVGSGQFKPYEMVTRGTAAVALYRLSGDDPPAAKASFSDVGSSHADAVAWAVEAGIAQGIGGGRFGVTQPVNRGQLAVMLYRFAQKQELMPENIMIAASLKMFPDGNAVPGYAQEAISWAIGNGIFDGIISESILPAAPVSRLQLAQALTALAGMKDGMAKEIHDEQPARVFQSASRDHHEEIQAAVDAAAKRYGAVGLEVAVVENGELTDTYAYGWATKGSARMTANHKFRVASLSKVVVGITAMLLREEGVVDLDASIGKYWGVSAKNPYYPDVPVSIRTLLTHTSSLPIDDTASLSYSAVKQRLQNGGFRQTRPGSMSSWGYNNYGFGVLGMTLELASNRTLDSVLQERLSVLMGIDGAFGSGDIQHTDMLATIYRNGSVGRTVETQKNIHKKGRPGETGIYFAGGFTTSAADLGKLTALLAADGRYEGVQLLSEESVKLMEARQQIADGSWQAMPMRYRTGLYGRAGIYYHTGSAYGVFNCMSYDPETGDGVVILTSGASGAQDSTKIYSVCSEINTYIYNILK